MPNDGECGDAYSARAARRRVVSARYALYGEAVRLECRGRVPSPTAGLDAGRRRAHEEGCATRRPAALVSVYRIKDSDTRRTQSSACLQSRWIKFRVVRKNGDDLSRSAEVGR